MKKSSLIISALPVLFFILLISKIAVLSGCANIIPPSGGPRDSLPPVLMGAVPPDEERNFKASTIEFTFDEYIEVQSIQENLIISPVPQTNPVVESKLRTLTVKFREDLEPNTTYSLNFGKAIKDVNEGNVLKEFSYIFSTGPNLDSMELTGSVKLAETGGVDSTLIVMLHRSGEDSALVNENPRYVTRLDNKGFFHFRFLAPGTYYIYAIKDESSTRRYYSPTQLFAFADSSIEVGSELSPVTLYAFAEPAAQTGGSQLISFGGGRGPSRGEDRRLRVTNNLNNNIQDLLNDFSLSFEQPLMNIDTNKLRLSTDSSFNPVTGYSWTIDSTNKKITLNTKWRENTLYNLVMDIDFAEDSSGKKLLKTDTLHFTTRRLEEYGSVKITFHNLDTLQNHVLLVLQSNRVVKAIPFQQDVIYQPMVNPGEYDLRILYDRNGNNRWDPGEFFGKHVQPEIVKPIDRKVSVKANFENDIEINL